MNNWTLTDDGYCGNCDARKASHLSGCTNPIHTHGFRMTWTTNKPTVPGWYWWRTDTNTAESIVFVYQHYGQWEVDWGENTSLLNKETDGQWAGPLEPPT